MIGKRFKETEGNNDIREFVVNNNKIFVITACILLAVAALGLMYAYFTDVASVTAPITTGYAAAEPDEDSPFDAAVAAEGANTDVKTFRAVSTGNINEYVRAKIITSVEYYNTADSAWEVANIPQTNISLAISGADWIEQDGYYYYDKILAPDETSSSCTVKVTDVKVPQAISTAKIRVKMRVMLEAAQSDYDLWKGIFGITSLPF
ncbi:MAG: SipW-dependent-type signal peptide-containing protein [Firmicutes bacterium]|nr:SipW-dependent-type signal peptide-containing protein [Bacillota bacterium]